MRKLFLTLLIILVPVMVIGCGSINKENIATISKEEEDNNLDGMGIKYSLQNLKKGEYDIQLYGEEYQQGKLKEKHELIKSQIAIDNKNKSIPVEIYCKEENLNIKVDGTYRDGPLDLFNNLENGMAFIALGEKEEIGLNKELEVAAYSIGNKDKYTEGIDLNGDYKSSRNEKDFIIHLKINKID